MRASFAGFEVDTTTYELRRGADTIQLEPQVFDVLAHLVRHHDRVVTKEELLDTIWGDRFVSESALTSRIKLVRRALGDDGKRQELLQTVHGRGYRLIADVTLLSDRPAPATTHTRGHKLPSERTPLLGRDTELEQLVELIGSHRLVTLVGLGGIGKTRLATAAAWQVLDDYPDGVWFVDLIPAGDAGSVATAIAHDLGLALSSGDTRAQLATLLADRRALIVLDNCEHVRAEVAAELDHLLTHTTGPTVLATSREPLGLPDERRVTVGPLAVEEDDAPAARLFRHSAELLGVALDEADDPAVARICRQLDGLPLAIELAAAQLRIMRPRDLADRLDRRFELLHEPERTTHPRHASLEAVLDDTWASLGAEEQQLAGLLAAFAATFDLTDVEALCGDRLADTAARSLATLVDRSLVTTVSDTDRRFRLLDSVRLFAGARTDRSAARALHADWCRSQLGTAMTGHLFDFDVANWCTAHFDDVIAAERRLAADGRFTDAAELIAGTALAMHCDTGARAAGVLGEIPRIVAQVDPHLAARVHLTGVLCGMATRSPAAIAEHGSAALTNSESTDDDALRALALVHHSWSTVLTDPALALRELERAQQLVQRSGPAAVGNLAAAYRAYHHAWVRRYDDAIAQAEAVAGDPPWDDDQGQATFVAVTLLAACELATRPERARAWLTPLLSYPSPERPMWGNLVVGAAVLASVGETSEAVRLTDRVRTDLAAAGHDSMPDLLVPAIALALRQGAPDRARRWVRAARDAGRPTQSFQVTCAYRRLREVAGIDPNPVLDETPLDAIGDEALAWMRGQF